MEKQNNQICTGLLRNCALSRQTEKSVTKKELKPLEKNEMPIDKPSQKPWSIYGEHYWI